MSSHLIGRIRNFYHRPAGVKEVLAIALPMVVSSLSWTVMTFADRMMLNWVSGDNMTAAFQGNIVWFCLMCLPWGICGYANTFVSQYFGDQQYRRIGPVVWQAIWVALLSTPMILAMIPFANSIFSIFGHSADLTKLEVTYFQVLCCAAGGMLVSLAASSFYSGRGQTGIVMIIDCLFAVLNLLLNYFWIFGNGGFPAMGIFGAALATAVSLWLKAGLYIFLITRTKHRTEFGTFDWKIQFALINRLLKFGVPSGIQIFLDVIGFTIFVMLLGRLGPVEAQASSMAFSISSFAFMPVMGLATAVMILVGQRLGENRADLAEQSTWTTLSISLGYMVVISIFYLVTPQFFLFGFFATDPSAQTVDSGAARELAVRLLQFVAAYNLFDATFMVMASAVKGAGDTRFVMWLSFIMAVLLGSLTLLTVEVFNLGIYACWGLITLWVCAFGVVFLLRFLGGKWKSMRVIDMQHPVVEQGVTN